MRAIVLFQADDVADVKVAFEVSHVTDVSAAKRVNGLIVVTNGENRITTVRSVRAMTGQQLEPAILQAVGVLELVDKNMAKPRLIMLAQDFIARQQLEAAQQQLGEVHRALTLALRIVGRVQLDSTPGKFVKDLDFIGAVPGLLGAVYKPLHLTRRELVLINIQRLEHAFDRRKLVLGVENLEGLRQAGIAVMRTQHAITKPVEGPHPHAARVDRHHGRQAHQHFLRRLIGEGDRKQAVGRDVASLDQPGDARCQDTRLARAGAGQNERRLVRQRDSRELLGI